MTDLNAPDHTPLYGLHTRLGAQMMPFAGSLMPLHYADGILREHLHTRAHASLFDVSHMGQAWLTASGQDPALLLECLVPADLVSLLPGQQRYTQLLNAQGGILDDLIVTRVQADRLYLVVNAGRKQTDFSLIAAALGDGVRLDPLVDAALLAVQGPAAVTAVAALFGEHIRAQPFMSQLEVAWNGVSCLLSRSGYTGEDGFEISVPGRLAEDLAGAFLTQPDIRLAGLGARDSLRLEAGLCLYGSDIDETTTPVEAGLTWSIGKRRRTEGGFPGAERILAQIADRPPRRRVGICPDGKAPARAGTVVLDVDGVEIGRITSGGFAPSVNGPVAIATIDTAHTAVGTVLHLVVRGRSLPARVVKMPFVPHRYYRD